MKKLAGTIPSITSSRASEPTRDLTRAKRVWTAMAEMFGNPFLTQFGELPPSVWIAQVERLTDDEIRRGLNNLADEEMRFPPNLTQFVAACKRLPPVRHLGVPQIEDQRPSGRMSFADWKKQNSR